MRCRPETGGGDSGVSALTSAPRYVGGGRVLEDEFVGVEIKKVSAEAARTAYAGPSLTRALS
jgi:hypothetical protein